MKKIGFLILGVSSCILLSGVARAQTKALSEEQKEVASTVSEVPTAKKEVTRPLPVVAAIPAEHNLSAQDIRNNEALENAKITLASKEWEVYLSMANGKRSKSPTDVLTFKDGKVASKDLVAQGYAESNFTLSINGDGVAVWETMQVNEKVGLAFLRGELQGTVMRGAISMQPQKGEKSTLYFNSEAPRAQAQAAPVAVEQKPPKKKGKK